jgi:hypothetical protein
MEFAGKRKFHPEELLTEVGKRCKDHHETIEMGRFFSCDGKIHKRWH